VGIELVAKIGDHVDAKQPLAILHVRDASRKKELVEVARGAFTVGSRPAPKPRLILGRVAR